MKTKYCNLCDREVVPKRETKAGDIIGFIIMLVMAFIFPITIVFSFFIMVIWLISNIFSKKPCPICGNKDLK